MSGEEMKQTFDRRDYLFLAALFVTGILLTVCVYHFSGNGSAVTVTVDGKIYGTYALNEEQEIPIELDGRIANVIVIENGATHMKNADCRDGLCMRQGAISRNRQTIVCLPHKLVVEVVGGEEQAYDSISG